MGIYMDERTSKHQVKVQKERCWHLASTTQPTITLPPAEHKQAYRSGAGRGGERVALNQRYTRGEGLHAACKAPDEFLQV